MKTLHLTNGQISSVLIAITKVKIDFMNELRNENLSEKQKEIAKRSLDMWNKLHNEIKDQLDAQ